jgi:hypothetical protein
MGAGFLDAFGTRRGLKYFIPRSPEDRSSQAKKFGVIVGDEYFSCIVYFLLPTKSL